MFSIITPLHQRCGEASSGDCPPHGYVFGLGAQSPRHSVAANALLFGGLQTAELKRSY
jgi:hypothetical protein